MSSANDWRPIVAALGNADTRRVFAQVVLGHASDDIGAQLSPSKRKRTIDALVRAGIVFETPETLEVNEALFTKVLEATPARPPKEGVERFLDVEGRIDRYPANKTERGVLLARIAETVLEPEEVVNEAELNARLIRFTDDTAVLRRYLVDYNLLERTRSGSQYARTQGL